MSIPANLKKKWIRSDTSQRFGQWFISHYIKAYDVDNEWWQLLWNTTSISVATDMIALWCINNQYTDTLPPRIQ